MWTDTLSLNLSGTHVRVDCEDQMAASMLRSVLADYLAETPAPTGFVLKAPEGRNSLHTLLDRSGFVLCRSRTSDDCVATLLSHLAAFAPPPSNTTRLRLRAFLRDDSTAVLAIAPLFMDPPTVERRIQREGFRILDRLAIDITPDGSVHVPSAPWPDLSRRDDPPGHASTESGMFQIAALLMPQHSTEEPTRAALVAGLANLGWPNQPRADRLAVADRLASSSVRMVKLNHRSARYRALSG